MELKDLNGIIDIDIDGSLARFGDMIEFYVKFLKKFSEDKNFEDLKIALDRSNVKKIEEIAHTLKGVAGNLGLNKVYQYSNEIVNLARENKLEEINNIRPELEKEMQHVTEILKKLI